VSEPPFDTLNLGRAIGDRPEAVEENYRRFAAALPVAPGALFEVSQVHGAVVRRVTASDVRNVVRADEADGLVTTCEGHAVGVRVADCLPLLVGHPATGAVAAIHVGWRGAVARIVAAALDVLDGAGAPASELVAAIGPHIRVDAFEVGFEVADALSAAANGVDVVRRSGGLARAAAGPTDKPHVDLGAVVRAQLQASGVRSIDDIGGCTYAEPERFFSYRRDGSASGRHLAAIVAGVRPSSTGR
jgi:hypothetical protein